MKQTLEKVRETALRTADATRLAEEERLAVLRVEALAAAPLVEAFRDLEDQYVRIEMLREIFPRDYDRRDDRVRGLLVEYLGDAGAGLLNGVAFHVPNGEIRFRVSHTRERGLTYLATRNLGTLRASSREFVVREDWIDHFFRIMADLVEV